MSYQEYLYSNLLKLYDEEFSKLEYDLQWEIIPQKFLEFYYSNFNNENLDLYTCMINYLENERNNK